MIADPPFGAMWHRSRFSIRGAFTDVNTLRQTTAKVTLTAQESVMTCCVTMQMVIVFAELGAFFIEYV
ncbi:MAG: hypothetical protein ACJ74Y_10870 [Bryobacteraceae bacterium]